MVDIFRFWEMLYFDELLGEIVDFSFHTCDRQTYSVICCSVTINCDYSHLINTYMTRKKHPRTRERMYPSGAVRRPADLLERQSLWLQRATLFWLWGFSHFLPHGKGFTPLSPDMFISNSWAKTAMHTKRDEILHVY